MKVKIKLFGTLSDKFPDYNPHEGMEVEIRDGSKVKDLLAHMGLSQSMRGIVVLEGRVMNVENDLHEGALVQIFQPVFGG
jgi:sulfur carrier protein ThiS